MRVDEKPYKPHFPMYKGPLIPIKGIRQVSVLPASGNKQGYIIVEVETDYNKRF